MFYFRSYEPKLVLCSHRTGADNSWIRKKKVWASRQVRDTDTTWNMEAGNIADRVPRRLTEQRTGARPPGQRTWEMSITASQLRGLAEVRSLKPSRVEIIPFWSILRIMVPSTKKITPYLSTVMPADRKSADGQREGKIFVRCFFLSVFPDFTKLTMATIPKMGHF